MRVHLKRWFCWFAAVVIVCLVAGWYGKFMVDYALAAAGYYHGSSIAENAPAPPIIDLPPPPAP